MPFSLKSMPKQAPATKTTTTGSVGGMDLRDYPQFLDASRSLRCENYTVDRDGRLTKRKGTRKLEEVVGGYPVTMYEKFSDSIYMYAYNTTLAAYNKITKESYVIKSDFVQGITSGVRYGNDFYTCNGPDGDTIYITTMPQLNYDAQTADFTVGAVITGATSGATAVILADDDSGTSGTLTIDTITGTFQDNEVITDSAGGSADVDGTLFFTTGALSNAPKCQVLYIFASRLCAGRTDTNVTETKMSEVNDFTNWTAGTDSGDPLSITFSRAGKVNSLGSLFNQGTNTPGNQLLIFYDDGYLGLRIGTVTVGTTISQDPIYDFQTLEKGAYSSISVSGGAYYVNDYGVFLRRNGQDMADQDENLTYDLGTDFIRALDFTDADLAFDPNSNNIYITCKQQSDTNNFVLWFNSNTAGTKKRAWGYFTGWAISRFFFDNEYLQGASSTATKLYQCLDTYDDEGASIHTYYEQEINSGTLETIKDLERIFVGGYLTPDYTIKVSFDVYNENGTLVEDVLQFDWDSTATLISEGGFGEIGHGTGGFGAQTNPIGTVWSPATIRRRYYSYLRLVLKLTEVSDAPHQINYVSLETREIRKHRKNLLTKI